MLKKGALIFILSYCWFSGIGQITSITQKYDPYLQELNTGVAILMKKNDTIETASIGNFECNENSVFNIGSATKTFTAILLLQEEEKGNLKLTDSIGMYLSNIKNVDGKLSIKALLKHESGLGELAGEQYEAIFLSNQEGYTMNFLDGIPKGDSTKIGTYSYCNTNYILLGHILEKVTDKSYFDLLKERIFIPCQMTETYPYVSKSIKNLAHPTIDGVDVFEHIDHRFFAKYAFSAGSIASTLSDMEIFYTHLYTKRTLLSEHSFKKMIDFGESKYGLGVMKQTVDGTDYYGHGGNNVGYSYRNYYNPKTNDLLLFFANAYATPFKKILRSECLNRLNDTLSTIKFNETISSDFKVYEGKYFFEEMELEMEIKEENNHLYLHVQGAKLILVSYNENKLNDGEFGIELEPVANKSNQLFFRQNGMETIIKRM